MDEHYIEDDILLIDKPAGITSFDCIRILRRGLGIRKMGHAGTLDPMATGLMIIGIGSGTKKLTRYIKQPKTYEAEILIGQSTTTGDREGEIVEEKDPHDLNHDEVKEALLCMKGAIDLPVPVFSAVKIKGTALYKRARNKDVNLDNIEVPIKTMEIRDVSVLGIRTVDRVVLVHVELTVSSGTYIRSIAVELGRMLGYPATLASLRRTRIAEWSVEHAYTLKRNNRIH